MSSRKRSRQEIDTERQEVLADLERGIARSFRYASKEIRGDFDVALSAVEKSGWNLICVSKELKNNHEVVLAAVRQAGGTLKYASPALRANHEIVMAAVRQNGWALDYASPTLKANHDVVMAAVRDHGMALMHASSELRANPAIVRAAVQNHGLALEFASEDLRADKDLVLTAVRHDTFMEVPFKFAADNLRDDHHFVASAITACTDIESRPHQVLFTSDRIKIDLQAASHIFDTFGQARAFLHDNVQSRNSFMEFLCCVTSKAAAVAGNPVTKVNLDRVTSEKLHRHIAEYVGVPLGQGLEPVRLVKRVMPILEAAFRGGNNGRLAWLLQEVGRRTRAQIRNQRIRIRRIR